MTLEPVLFDHFVHESDASLINRAKSNALPAPLRDYALEVCDRACTPVYAGADDLVAVPDKLHQGAKFRTTVQSRSALLLRKTRSSVEKLLKQYEHFLEATNVAEEELIRRFQDRNASRQYVAEAYKFGDLMFEALSAIGGGSRFHRVLVV